MRVRLFISYDGTNYHGWQRQNNAITIQSELESAISKATGESVVTKGMSRTDAGVHAMCNMVIFDTASRIPASKMAFAINAYLPEDIRVWMSDEVGEDYDIRDDVISKTYSYKIWNDRIINPTKRLYTHHVHGELDVDRMTRALKTIVGEHDFEAFHSAGAQVSTTIRTLFTACVEKNDKEVIIKVCGNGFMYNMVRIISGTLIDIGLGRLGEDVFLKAFETKERNTLGRTAPARGLCLCALELKKSPYEVIYE